jgi:hypothetical protein
MSAVGVLTEGNPTFKAGPLLHFVRVKLGDLLRDTLRDTNMFRYWHGPVVGESVTHIWQGFASVLFIEFGALRPAGYVRRDGTAGEQRGEIELTTMNSYAAWELLLNGKHIMDAEAKWQHRDRALKRLIGRRLRMFEIDAASLSTRLSFGCGLMLRTRTLRQQLHPPPHWRMRLGSDDWPSVILSGTCHGGNTVEC